MLIVPRWLGALVVLGLTLWWALGLAVAGPGGDSLRLALAAIYALAGLAAVAGVDAGGGSPGPRHHPGRPRDGPRHPELRLPLGDRLHARVLRSHLRRPEARHAGPAARLLDGPGHRPHARELRVRRRPPGRLD